MIANMMLYLSLNKDWLIKLREELKEKVIDPSRKQHGKLDLRKAFNYEMVNELE